MINLCLQYEGRTKVVKMCTATCRKYCMVDNLQISLKDDCTGETSNNVCLNATIIKTDLNM